MKVLQVALAAVVLLPTISANKLMCVDDENQFNICLNVNGIADALIPSFVVARDRWDAAIDGDLDGTALSGIDPKGTWLPQLICACHVGCHVVFDTCSYVRIY